MILYNPTGHGIRSDSGGDGHFGAPRSKKKDGKTVHYKHEGTDFELLSFKDAPEQFIRAVIAGTLVLAYPYADDLSWAGCRIWGEKFMSKMFYFKAHSNLVGGKVLAGEVVGIAQNIGEKYEGVTPHIHCGLYSLNPTKLVNPENYLDTEENRLKNGGY